MIDKKKSNKKIINIKENEPQLNILRIDLDSPDISSAKSHLMERLSYAHDIDFIHVTNIKKIELIEKTKVGAKIILNFSMSNYDNLVMLESILGDDYRKTMNALINYHKLNMNHYPDRLFDVKRYSGGKIISANKFDFTDEIKNYILNTQRKKWKN